MPKTKPAIPSSLNIQDGDVTQAWTTKQNRCNVCNFRVSQEVFFGAMEKKRNNGEITLCSAPILFQAQSVA